MLKKGNEPLGTVMFNIKGHKVKLDREDLERVVRNAWGFKHKSYNVYFRTRINGKHKSLHRFIIMAKRGQIVDHINGNTLDNRKRNLRIVTAQQSTWNTGPRKGLKYKGIEKKLNKGNNITIRWRAKLVKDGNRYRSKGFPTMEQAARAYDKLARKHYGQYARLNFPRDMNKVMLRQ